MEIRQPQSLLEFQRMFPSEIACANYLERVRWPGGFTCPTCGINDQAQRITTRPRVIRCRHCCADVALTVGTVANASELARSLKLEVGWVCEVLRMTRLSPDIIRAILDGRQPRHLNLHAMRGRQGEVPLDWEEQRVLLGFAVAGG